MTQQFKYYLHDHYSTNELHEYLMEQGIVLSEEAWDNIYRPFYEVTLDCEVDDNGNITLLGAKL